ncbi:MAG: 30S ribosomal protein S12 methylthiotransferase RimO, partial [Verrucomicrobia bacterium]|nr:30S ribosomal protein S12 methylthiotransferase RimO [Verrucomicrobiota bacterium]
MIKEDSRVRPVRVGLISLGCAKNLVDAEVMVGTLLKDGVEITSDTAQADVVIVNTCSFIDSAQQESVDTILESGELREAKNRGQGLIVSGCLPQRFRDELPKLLPEVDVFMGLDQVPQVTELVKQALARRAGRIAGRPKARVQSLKSKVQSPDSKVQGAEPPQVQGSGSGPLRLPPALPLNSSPLVAVTRRPFYVPDYATPRFRLTPRHFAYVKIAEGCNHPCSFCIIPRIRGSHRSRPQPDIVAEAKALLSDGVKELNLISQDSTYYGLDLRPDRSRAISAPENFDAAVKSLPAQATTICTLLRELNSLPGNFWIRLLYTHPAHWTDELIQTIGECHKVARYVDIPLQHIHQNMLERMRRETSRQYIVDLIRRIRAGVPGITLRTTFIVGFPGETEACFEDLLGVIREARFERLGVFTYSQEEGTRAGSMAGQIPDKTRRKRRDVAMAAQHEVAEQVAGSFVGRTIKVLVEKAASTSELQRARVSSWEHGLMRGHDQHTSALKGRFLIARGEADAPDIDGRVYVRGQLPLGEFARVKVI